jgi:glucosamine kinase
MLSGNYCLCSFSFENSCVKIISFVKHAFKFYLIWARKCIRIMILIADSGASKSDWVLVDKNGERMGFQLIGLNPFYLTPEETRNILSKELTPFIEAKSIEKLFFYGAGCSSPYKCMMLEEAFLTLFKNSEIIIHSDLLGSARALFGNKPGIACILGTGSNSCYYDGVQIMQKAVSLGYFFGDEGSGAHMGKQFIKDFLMGTLPDELNEAFKKNYNYTRDNILDAVYNLPFPNRFLASFCEFFTDHLSSRYIFTLITNSFREFFLNYVEIYPMHKALPVSFTGSIAYYFEPLLKQVAMEHGISIEKIIQSPIKLLAEYHKP